MWDRANNRMAFLRSTRTRGWSRILHPPIKVCGMQRRPRSYGKVTAGVAAWRSRSPSKRALLQCSAFGGRGDERADLDQSAAFFGLFCDPNVWTGGALHVWTGDALQEKSEA